MALLGAFGAEALVVVVPAVRLDTLLHLCQSLFYAALVMAIAIATRRAGRLLDLASLSAISDASAAAAADARRAQRRRVEGLIHDTVIVALLAFGRGTKDDDARAAREAAKALVAIDELAASAQPADDPTPASSRGACRASRPTSRPRSGSTTGRARRAASRPPSAWRSPRRCPRPCATACATAGSEAACCARSPPT
ncbi:hypothetical protein GCM10025881_36170 [Pseudolysinimonas kribbensis]|uniref:Signal transduction histidine kinase subgroup 3 dimerisation and phosphoacceptor domain-containing protein n=1 Tax=Pseudolysinimonas kribbensis TaxID=433641 RepID=A0ABQ6K831_9MICO|nr:hypothetical protein GCM10025881_36170 [Pseudolysinimonas kribbensis]